jgi:hypothetical protein
MKLFHFVWKRHYFTGLLVLLPLCQFYSCQGNQKIYKGVAVLAVLSLGRRRCLIMLAIFTFLVRMPL